MSGSKIILVAVILVFLYLSSYAVWRRYRADILGSWTFVSTAVSPSKREFGPVTNVEFVIFYPCIYAEVNWYFKRDSGPIKNGFIDE